MKLFNVCIAHLSGLDEIVQRMYCMLSGLDEIVQRVYRMFIRIR